MKGVILAAGKGSRLYPVTHHIPKPLLPLANRMTIEYAFDRLKELGIREVAIVVGENEESMRGALGDGSRFGLELTYVRQPEPKGLAHAVSFAKQFVNGDSFVLYLGDAIYSHGFQELAEKFRSSGCANLNVLKEVEDPRRFGVAHLEGDKMTKLVEKPQNPESNLALCGLYFFGPKLWEVLPDLQPSARGEYEITDAIQLMVDRGMDVRGGLYHHTWFDTGTLDSFLETSQFLAGDGLTLGDSADLAGTAGEHVVIGNGAHVTCALIEDSVILPGADVKVTGTIRRSILMGSVHADGDLIEQIVSQ
ncbi:MAG: NTP transferase domain-containing protein [Chthonomonas sp.]|nr:NTP transferase domain-containing protein [Chthonomonas sp.]